MGTPDKFNALDDDALQVIFMADTHNSWDFIEACLNELESRTVVALVHLGDVTRGETLSAFNDYRNLHLVLGNNDVEHQGRLQDVCDFYDWELHGWDARVEFGSKMFLLRHGMERAPSYALVASDPAVDYVMHGHYHYAEQTEVGDGKGVVLNPGATGIYCYDIDEDEFEHVEFDIEPP